MSRTLPCASCAAVLPSLRGLANHERATGHKRDAGLTVMSMVEATDSGCWDWLGQRSQEGYGRLGEVFAHRLAYEAFRGPIPPGMYVCHTCDNPPCCNPDHLFIGTNADNVRDSMSKGRWPASSGRHWAHLRPELAPRGERHGSRTHPDRVARGERHGHARLTEAQVRLIRTPGSGSAEELAARFGVTKNAVYMARNGTTWKAVR